MCRLVLRQAVFSAVLLLCALGFARAAFAEPLFQFHTLNKSDGLTSSVVYDVTEDSDGFIWLATEDGLQKYDGFELITFRHDRLDESSISNNVVRVVFIDKAGHVWVGTDNGLNRFIRNAEKFERIELSETFQSVNGINRIRAVSQTSDGTIWIGTTAGLVKMAANAPLKFYPNSPVRSMFEDDRKEFWVGTLYSGLFRFDRASETFLPVDIISEGNEKPTSLSIVDIKQDSFDRIFVATWGDGVYLLRRDLRKLIPYDIALPSRQVRSIHQDESGQIWFGTSKGMAVYEAVSKKLNLIVANDRNSASLISDNVTQIFQSSDDTIWVGTYGGGISRHFPASRKFESFGLHSIPAEGLLDPVIYALSENDEGDVWVGTETGKLSKFFVGSGRFKHYQFHDPENKSKHAIRAILEVAPGVIFVGTSRGLFKFDSKTQKVSPIINQYFSASSLIEFVSRDLKQRLWIGVKNQGVFAFELNNQLALEPIAQLSFGLKDAKAIYHTSENASLLATSNSGLFAVDTTPETELNKLSASNSAVLSSVKQQKDFAHDSRLKLFADTEQLNIFDLSRDWKGRIWLATWSNGIKIINDKGNITHLDEASGLPNNSVYTVIPDINSKKIWASTNYGIVSVEPETLKITHFTSADGLQSNEFNRPALLAKNGYLYFGGINGMDKFFPNIIESQLSVKPPTITELRVANKKLEIGVPGGLSRSISVENKVKLDFEQTPFSIKFTSPQYVKPKELEFRYRMLGLSDKWILAGTNLRQATYTNVDSGDYQFQLQVKNLAGSWLENTQYLDIEVLPPWWLAQKYIVIYSVLAASMLTLLGYLFWRKRYHELKVQQAIKENEERLKLSLWGSGYEFWDWNIETGEVSRSNEIKKIQIECPRLSYSLNELASYIHPEDLQSVREKLSNHIVGNSKHFDMCYRIVDARRGWRWIQDRAKVVLWSKKGTALRMSGTQRDITDIRERDAQFEMLGQAFRSTSDGVWIRDDEWRLVECNPAFERITGFSLIEKKGEVLWFPEIQEQPENLQQRIRISIDEKGSWQGEAWAERKNTTPFPQKLSIDTLHDEQGNVRYYVGVFTDITFHKRTEEEFRKLANYDSLTGLPNRACLYDRLNQTIDKSKRDKKRFALFLVDIDNFKRINDSLGHSVGDILIRQISSRLVNCNKEGDTVARIGGDEFVIVMENVRSSTSVAAFAELLLQELNQPIFVKGQQLKLNFSIGITLGPDDAIIAERLMRNADTAMYEAKKSVENSYRFFSVEFNERAKLRLSLENALRKAIDDKTLNLYYQPKVDLDTGAVVGLEALARWTDKEFGFVSPTEFIPLAEETGLILPLGGHILEMAIKQTKDWVDLGIMQGRTSINLSANQFWNRALATEISELLAKYDLDASHIELEITESACMQDLAETKKQINILKELGISLALDDFGTGYSSLSQLKALPFDTLKVDKSFVDNIERDSQDAKVVKAIIDIAKTMEMNVVIEGVESKSQCEYLWKCRAYTVQGFFFSKPVKPQIMEKLFEKRWHKKEYLGRISNNVTPLA